MSADHPGRLRRFGRFAYRWGWPTVFAALGFWSVLDGAAGYSFSMGLVAGLLFGINLGEIAARKRPEPKPTGPNPEDMATLMDGMVQIEEAVQGYRSRLERRGFSPTAAEHMATSFHQALLFGGKR